MVILTAVVLGAATGSETASDHVKDFPLVQADYRQMDGMSISGNADRMKSVLGSASHFYVTYDTEASETSSTYSEDLIDNHYLVTGLETSSTYSEDTSDNLPEPPFLDPGPALEG